MAVIAVGIEIVRELRKSASYKAQAESCREREKVNMHFLNASRQSLSSAIRMQRQEQTKPGKTGQTSEEWEQEIHMYEREIAYYAEWVRWWSNNKRTYERAATRPWEGRPTISAPPHVKDPWIPD